MILVVDASAAVEYLLQTPLGVRAASLLDDADLAAPELLDAEVLAVLRREVLRGRLAEARASEAVADLRLWSVERLPHTVRSSSQPGRCGPRCRPTTRSTSAPPGHAAPRW